MKMKAKETTHPGRRRRRLVLGVLLLALLTGGYWLFTSSFFLCRVALPYLSQRTGLLLSFEAIDWRPLSSRLEVRGMVLGPPEDPFLRAGRVSFRYKLFRLLEGDIAGRRLRAEDLELFFHRDRHGVWRFDRLLRPAEGGGGASDRAGGEPSAAGGSDTWPLDFDLHDIRISNARVSLRLEDQARELELTWDRLELQADSFVNGGTTAIRAAGVFHGNSQPAFQVRGRLGLTGEIEWDRLFLPGRSSVTLAATDWQGNFDAIAVRIENVSLDLNTEQQEDRFAVTHLLLRQLDAGDGGSRAAMTGHFSYEPRQLVLDAEELRLDSDLLMVFSDFLFSINPGVATLEGHGRLRSDFRRLAAAGDWVLDRRPGPASFNGEKIDLPGFVFRTDHDFTVDFADNALEVRKMVLELTEEGRSAWRVRLRSPLQVDLAREQAAAPPGLDLELDNFDLKLTRFFLPKLTGFHFLSGRLSGTAAMDFDRNLTGAVYRGNLTAAAADFRIGEDLYRNYGAAIRWDSEMMRDLSLHFRRFELDVDREGRTLLESTASLDCSIPKRTGRMQFAIANLDDGIFETPFLRRQQSVTPLLAPFRPLAGQADLALGWTDRELKLEHFRAEVSNRRSGHFALEIEPQRLELAKDEVLDDWKCRISLQAPLTELNPLLAANGVRFLAGRLKFQSTLQSSRNFSSGNLAGRLLLEEITAAAGPFSLHRLDLEHEFSFYLPERGGKISLPTHNIFCRVAGQPALRLEAPGVYDPASGRYETQMTVRYCNERFFRLLFPGLVREAALSGTLRLQGDMPGRTAQLTANLGIGKLRAGASGAASGTVNFEFRAEPGRFRFDHCRFAFFQGPRQLLIGGGEALLPFDPARLLEVNLAAEKLDLPLLLPFFDHSAGATGKTRAGRPLPGAVPELRTPLDFGDQELRLNLKLPEIAWDHRNSFSLHGQVAMQGSRLTAGPMIFGVNGAALEISLNLLDSAQGMAFSSAGRSLGPVEIEPLTSLFYAEPALRGKLEEIRWDLSAKNLPAAGVSTLRGRIDGRAGSLVIDNAAAHAPLLRVLLLPVEGLVRAGALIPQTIDVTAVWRRFWSRFATLDSPLARLEFSQGRFSLAFGGGKLEIRDFLLFGDPVGKLRFRGVVDLAKEQNLKLDSEVEVSGLEVKIPIYGTLAEPEISTAQLLTALTGGQITGLVSKVGSIFSGNSDDRFIDDPPEPESPSLLRRWFRGWFGGGGDDE